VAQGRPGGEKSRAAARRVRLFPSRFDPFTYLHLAPLPDLTDKLLAAKVNGVAYETIVESDGSLPLLTP